MDVTEAPDIWTLYDLWLVRWGAESVDVEHALNKTPTGTACTAPYAPTT